MVVFSKMDLMHTTSFQSYDDYLNSENYKRLCASENRKVSEQLLKSYCQSRYNASDNCQTSKSYILKKETLSSHNKSTFPVSPNYLPGDSSKSTTFLTKPSKVTTFPILNNSNLSANNPNTITASHSYFENNSSTTSFNNLLSLNNNTLFLTTKKSDINKLEEENNHITRPVIQTQINMLHRSPSGAARRIRQRREENSQRQFPILSSPNSASFNNNRSSSSEPSTGTVPSRETMIEGDNDYPKNDTLQMDYRGLMNSSSYKSILPDDDFNISYSRPPQRILCNSSSFISNASKIEGSNSEDSQNPEIPHTTSPPKFQEVDQNIITMESNKFLGKIDFSSLLSTTNTTTMNDDNNQHKIVIPPVPPKRTSIASSGENSVCEPSPKITGNVNNNITNDHKPIIEVHPMPAPRKNHTHCEDSSLNMEKGNERRIPPPLPKKPSKFVFKTDLNSPIIFKSSEPYFSLIESQQSTSIPPSPAPRAGGNQYSEKPMVRQRFDSLPSLSVSNTPHGNNKENERNNENNVKESTYNNLFIKNQNGACSSLSVSTSNLYSTSFISNSSNISSAQSTESLNQLFTSPSMLSLQNAYKNYPLMTEQDLEMLEEKRKNLVESLSRKMRVLEEEKVMIDEDIMENEEFKKRFLQKLDLDPQMLMRLNNHICQARTLSLLETKINIQLEKLDNYLGNDNNDMDPATLEFCQSRRNRLSEQLSDSSMLRNLHRSRDVEIEKVLLSKYFIQPEQLEEWRIYKDSLVRLLTEKRQMEDRLNQAKHQISILDTLALQANALMKSLGTSNTHTRETSSGASSMISSSDNSRANTLDSGEIVVGDLRTGNSMNNGTSNTSTALTV